MVSRFIRWFMGVDARGAAGSPTPPVSAAARARLAMTPGPTRPPIQYRQGDVLLVAVTGLPPTARRKRRQGRLVLATGEATGHAHAIVEPDAEEFTFADQRYVLVRSRAQLVHEEHAPIDLPAGTYRVVIQREFVRPTDRQAGASASRRVLD
jgi:hypothetical protein